MYPRLRWSLTASGLRTSLAPSDKIRWLVGCRSFFPSHASHVGSSAQNRMLLTPPGLLKGRFLPFHGCFHPHLYISASPQSDYFHSISPTSQSARVVSLENMGRATLFSALAFLAGHVLQATAIPSAFPQDNAVNQVLLSDSYQDQSVSSISAEDDAQNSAVIHIGESETMRAPSWFTSTLMARRLLALSTTGTVSTIFPDPLPGNSHAPPSVAGLPISLPEYIADCDEYLPADVSNGGNGDPTFLALHISTTFRNTAAGSNVSLAIDWWDHLNQTEPVAPGFPPSEAGLPRVTLIGYVEPFDTPLHRDIEAALEECYLSVHPDASAWLPGKPGAPHSSYWAKMVVEQVYWIGGFGGLQQIGWMNVTEWKGIRRVRSLPGVGDGRGWEDVRLPGEKE